MIYTSLFWWWRSHAISSVVYRTWAGWLLREGFRIWILSFLYQLEGNGNPLQHSCLENLMAGGDCSKFSKPGFSNMWTVNFLMFKLGLEKAEEQEFKLPTSARSWKKPESSRKTSISALLTMPKLLTVWITINCGNFWKRWEYQTTWLASWENYMQVRKQQLELDMEQQPGSK